MFKNMKIGKRLIIGFIIAILLSSSAGITGIVMLMKSDSDYSSVLANYGFAQGELGNLGRHFQASRVSSLYVITAPDTPTRTGYMKELETEDAEVDKYMLQVKARLGTELGQQVYAELSAAMQKFRADRSEVFKVTEGSVNARDNIAIYREKMADSSTAVRETLDTMIEDKSRIGGEKSIGLSQQAVLFVWIMAAIMVVAFTVAMLLAASIARGISKPIVQIEKAASHMAKGDYDVEITCKTRDEIGSLSDSMREMVTVTKNIIADTSRGLNEMAVGNFDISARVEYIGVFDGIKTAMIKIISDLSATLSQIKMSAEQVSSGSEQVSSGAQALAQGATEQASSVQELSASISEVSQQIRDSADNAAVASKVVDNVGGSIHTSSEQMAQMMSAMTDISSSSSQIGKIIKTIEDIAFQTNILALNAAVEAARAGAAGKGFAVVADEVRNLATKSSEAAKQTNALIEGSVKSVENGVKIADATAKSLTEVVTGAQEITSLISKISDASAEQSNSITQINLGIEQISAVVQTNSATSEESAAASEELNGQANLMKAMVSKFKLKGGEGEEPELIEYSEAPEAYRDSDFASADKY